MVTWVEKYPEVVTKKFNDKMEIKLKKKLNFLLGKNWIMLIK